MCRINPRGKGERRAKARKKIDKRLGQVKEEAEKKAEKERPKGKPHFQVLQFLLSRHKTIMAKNDGIRHIGDILQGG